MKAKNIKVGVRVQSKVNLFGVRVGDVGTVLEEDDANYTDYRGTPCTSVPHFELRKYKE